MDTAWRTNNDDGVGANESEGAYTATITDDTGGRVSVLTYTATTTLMDANIECQDTVGTNPPLSLLHLQV